MPFNPQLGIERLHYRQIGVKYLLIIFVSNLTPSHLHTHTYIFSGFGYVSAENVFKVCDQPHPLKVRRAIERAFEGKTREAVDIVMDLWSKGYAATDIIQTLFKVTRQMEISELKKLDFIREIGFSHMRIAEGLNSQLQLLGCVSRLAAIART